MEAICFVLVVCSVVFSIQVAPSSLGGERSRGYQIEVASAAMRLVGENWSWTIWFW